MGASRVAPKWIYGRYNRLLLEMLERRKYLKISDIESINIDTEDDY